MKLSKKTVIIISGISVAVVVLSLGVGLGVGLSSSSSPSSQVDIGSGSGGSGPIDTSPVYRVGNYAFHQSILDEGTIIVDDVSYNVAKEGGKYYITIPEKQDLSLSKSLVVPKMFGTYGTIYKQDTINEWGKGKDGYYIINFMDIGPIKIKNDIIYGGYQEIKENDIVTGYEVEDYIKNTYSEGYEIGSFNEDGRGGINMLKLETLKQLLQNPNISEENIPTTTEFGFFEYNDGDKVVIKLGTSNPYILSGWPHTIGYKPQDIVTSLSPGIFYDEINKPSLYEEDGTTLRQRTEDINFVVREFKNKDGSDYKITLEANDPANATKTVLLKDLYMPLIYNKGWYHDSLIGTLKQSISDSKIHLPDSIVVDDGSRTIDVVNSSFSLPNMKLFLDISTFNADTYATATTSRNKHELLINTEAKWYNYFVETANLPEVRDLAKEYGITIRFKINDSLSESKYIFTQTIYDDNASEVFFVQDYNYYAIQSHSIDTIFPSFIDKVAPFKFTLKEALLNPIYYDEAWKYKATLSNNENENNYGFYPFAQRDGPFIAYNSDYLPNGFDFSSKDISEYLFQGNVGDAATIRTRVNSENVTNEAKHSLLVPNKVFYGSTIFANDYYDDQKKDQFTNQQDIVWKKKGTRNEYYTSLLDPNLKDNIRFQRLVDHYKNNDPLFRLIPSVLNSQFKDALFNGHIGSILTYPRDVNQRWKNGEYLNDDTMSNEEKKAFVREKIKFQSLPRSVVLQGEFSSMSATLKNDNKKQELAEMFLYMLTDGKRGVEFNKATSKFLPRKDVDLSLLNDDIEKGIWEAMINTPKLKNSKLFIEPDDQFYSAYEGGIYSITSDSTYEQVANNFISRLNALSFENLYRVPVSP